MAAVAWSSRTRIHAMPLALRLRLDDEATLRFVFNDWEGVAGVKSNHAAQVEGLINGIHRRAVHLEARRSQRRSESRARFDKLDGQIRKRLPLSERGWPQTTAKPTKLGSGGFPMKTITIPGDREDPRPCIVTVASPEQWALMPNRIPGPQGPIRRDRVVQMFRHLQALNDRPKGARMLVVLHLLYGPRSPSADYLTFGELAPIVHMTPAAQDVTERTTLEQSRGLTRFRASPRTAIDQALHTGASPVRKELRDRLMTEANQLRTRAINALRDVMGVPRERA